jgi:hypothetical protein
MKTKLASIILTLILATASVAFGQSAQPQNSSPSAGATKTLTGVVSDSMCGAKHMAKDKTAAQCTRECIKTGMDYALVVGKKVYVLKGDKTEIDKLAGQRATVKGSVSGNTVTVESIAAAAKGTKS